MIDLLRGKAPKLSDLLDPDILEDLYQLASVVSYEDGQLVQLRGDAKPGLSIVKSGQVVAGNVGADGSLLMTTVIQTGDCFGEFTLFAGLPRTHDIYSFGPSQVCHIPKPKFLKVFAEKPELAEVMLTLALYRNHGLLEYLDNLRRQPLLVRTAQLINSNIRSKTEYYEVETRQDQLAFTLGVSRVSVGKALSTLQKDGLIELGYGKIKIPSTTIFRRWLEERTLLAPLNSQKLK